MKLFTLRLPLALLTFFATSSAFAMSPMLERILAGIDTVPNHAELFMALDFPVAELESAAADVTHHSTTASAQPAFYQR